jgi:hypothetical protein
MGDEGLKGGRAVVGMVVAVWLTSLHNGVYLGSKEYQQGLCAHGHRHFLGQVVGGWWRRPVRLFFFDQRRIILANS